jgi:hypothetical protein
VIAPSETFLIASKRRKRSVPREHPFDRNSIRHDISAAA